MNEWRPIPGFEDRYEISSIGEVRTKPRLLKPFMGGIEGRQYWQIGLRNKTFNIHRLVAKAFLGEPPNPEMEVDHLNGNKLDNRVENLEWVTSSENTLRAMALGLFTPPNTKGRKYAPSLQTHCPQGHLFDESNTQWYGRERRCRTCGNARCRAWYAANKVAANKRRVETARKAKLNSAISAFAS